MADIVWRGGFNRIAWAHEAGRLVVSPVFEDREMAVFLAGCVDSWIDRFAKLTIIEDESSYTVCCYQDPVVSGSRSVGIYRADLPRIGGYDHARPLFLERAPLFQIAYAMDYTRMDTYEQMSRLLSPARCRIIGMRDLKRQEYDYERLAAGRRPVT